MSKNINTTVTIELTPDLDERLEDLRSMTGSASKADTIRDALKVFEYLSDLYTQGYSFARQRKYEDPEPMDIFLPGTHISDRYMGTSLTSRK